MAVPVRCIAISNRAIYDADQQVAAAERRSREQQPKKKGDFDGCTKATNHRVRQRKPASNRRKMRTCLGLSVHQCRAYRKQMKATGQLFIANGSGCFISQADFEDWLRNGGGHEKMKSIGRMGGRARHLTENRDDLSSSTSQIRQSPPPPKKSIRHATSTRRAHIESSRVFWRTEPLVATVSVLAGGTFWMLTVPIATLMTETSRLKRSSNTTPSEMALFRLI